jgi:hypothetical protein
VNAPFRHEIIPAQEAETLNALAKQDTPFLRMFPKRGPLSRATVVEAFNTAFEQIGGVSRFALWADANPGDFYRLYAKLLPPSNDPALEGDREYVVRHALPPSRLDAAPSEKE